MQIQTVCILALMSACCLMGGCSDVIWSGDLAGAQRQAAKPDDRRFVLVYYWSAFDGDSLRMDSDVFMRDDVIETMRGTIPVRVGPLTHSAWAREHGMTKPPSFVILGPDGDTLGVRTGPLDPNQFRAFVVASKLNQ